MAEIDYSRHYLRYHSVTDEHYRKEGGAAFEQLEAFLPPNRGARIFEFGCGMGFALDALRSAGYADVAGIDASPAQVAAARQRELRVDLVPFEHTLDHLRARKGAYDFVFAIDVLEHIPVDHTIDVAQALVGTLVPGGRFFCRVPNCNTPIASRQRYNDWTHFTAFGDASLDFVLHNAGLDNISVRPTPDSFPGARKSAITWIARRLVRGVYWFQLAVETSIAEARRTSLSPNIIGTGTARRTESGTSVSPTGPQSPHALD